MQDPTRRASKSNRRHPVSKSTASKPKPAPVGQPRPTPKKAAVLAITTRLKMSPPSAAGNWQSVVKVFKRHFDKPDIQAIKAVYASFAAHSLQGQPVWPLLVGPPGSLKSVLLMSLDGLPETHIIDQLTPKTFISGFVPDSACEDDQPAGLLFRIGKSGKIICPDFSTILSMNRDHRGSIFSDLRRIYDGMLRKEFGTPGGDMNSREWRGRITFLAAGTGDIDRAYSVFGSLGERFVLIRWSRAGFEAAQRAVTQDIGGVNKEVADAVRELFNGLSDIVPTIPPELEQTKIPSLGDFIGYARTQVERESGGKKDIIDVPEAESATRISQQLCQLAKGSAVLAGRNLVNEADWKLVVRVALDCLPPSRGKIVRALIYTGEALIAAQALGDALPESTRRYAEDDLEALGVLKKIRAVSQRMVLSERSKEQLRKAGLLE